MQESRNIPTPGNIENLIKRIRAAVDCGMNYAAIEEHFVALGETKANVFFCWHAACILTQDEETFNKGNGNIFSGD